GRVRAERAQPYWDLAALVEARPGMLVADLGCGTGELTAELHRKLQARETLGVDSSQTMLAKAPQGPGLRFEQQDIATFQPTEKLDLIFINAALHWVPDHPDLLRRLTGALSPGGQIAVQVPMADDLVPHQTASELARSPEFRRLLGGYVRRTPLLDPIRYAAWLYRLGYARQHVRVVMYTHLLEPREEGVGGGGGARPTDYQTRPPAPASDRAPSRSRPSLA